MEKATVSEKIGINLSMMSAAIPTGEQQPIEAGLKAKVTEVGSSRGRECTTRHDPLVQEECGMLITHAAHACALKLAVANPQG